MLDNAYVANIRLAIQLAYRIKSIRDPDAQLITDRFMQADLGAGNLVSVLSTQGGNFPTMYYGQLNGVTLILFDGVENLYQAGALTSGYYLTQGGGISRTTNRYLTDSIAYYNSFLAGTHITRTGNFVIAGYSAGAALAYNYARWLTLNTDAPEPIIWTFGGCKPGDRTLADSFSPRFGLRFFNDSDPVPLFPFNLSTYTLYNPLAVFDDLVFVNNFCQPGGGVEVFANGTGRSASVPSAAASMPMLSFASWLLGQVQAPNGPHSIQTYINRLQLAVDAEPLPRVDQAQGGPPEVPPVLTPAEVRAGQAAAVQTIFRLGNIQQGGEVTIPEPQQFSAFHDGKIWAVDFRGTTVAIGPTKKRAHGLARVGNDLLRRLQRQGIVDPAAIADQFEAYFVQAADPNGGFDPVLNTVWNQ